MNMYFQGGGIDGLSMIRSTKSDHKRSRTLVSGLDTTQDPARTTCTRNTGRCLGQTRWRPSTRTWLRDIDLVLGRFTYAYEFTSCTEVRPLTDYSLRFSKLWRSKRPTMSSAPTSSNSSPRTSDSLSLTAFPRLPRRKSSLPTDPRPLLKLYWMWENVVRGRRSSMLHLQLARLDPRTIVAHSRKNYSLDVQCQLSRVVT